VNYAKKYSWENQARRHYRLAGRLLSTLPERAN
jgi:hypothetical protein